MLLSKKKFAIVGGVTAFALTSVVLLFGARSPAALSGVPITRGGVSLSQVLRSGVGSGPMVEASAGDWILESDQVRLVVGADFPGVERQLRYGALIDLTVQSFADDQLSDLKPRLEVAGTDLPLRTDAVRAVFDAERPSLRVVHSSRDGRLSLQTDISIQPGSPRVELVTRIENMSKEPVSLLRVGDRSRWPGAPTFAPRLGFVKFATRAQAPWIGREGRAVSYSLAFPEGAAEVAFRFDRVGPLGQSSMSPAFDLLPAQTREYRRVLAVAAGGLSRAAAVAWGALGKRVGRVKGVLLPPPSWASIDALDGSGRPVLSVTAARDGSYELLVPNGSYRLLLKAPGGEHSESVRVGSESPSGAPGSGRADVQVELLANLKPPEPGRLRLEATENETVPLPTRWIVRGLAPTKNPEFGPVESAEGAKNISYGRYGKSELEVPAGRYRVTATHGPEYSIFDQDLTVEAGRTASVRARLERVVDTSGFIACDFHLHADPSHDSSVSLDDRVLSLLAEGVEFAVATDHNHVTDYSAAIERQRAATTLRTASGVEITTKTWGHFNAFPYPAGAAPPAAEGSEPQEIFATVRSLSPAAVIQVNHPRMRGVGYFNRIELDGHTGAAATEGFSFEFDTIEVVNGFELGEPKTIEANIAEWFALLNLGRRYTAVGNSDSHRLVYQWPGYPRTYVRVGSEDLSGISTLEVARALREGRAIVSTGPFVIAEVDGKGPGDLVSSKRGRVKLEVRALAPDWIDVRRAEVYVNGKRVATAPAGPPRGAVRLEWETELRFEKDSWIVVVVRGDKLLDAVLTGTRAAPLAFTNPIFVDVDGDSKFKTSEFKAGAKRSSKSGHE